MSPLIYIYTHTHTHVYTYTRIHVMIYVILHACIYVYHPYNFYIRVCAYKNEPMLTHIDTHTHTHKPNTKRGRERERVCVMLYSCIAHIYGICICIHIHTCTYTKKYDTHACGYIHTNIYLFQSQTVNSAGSYIQVHMRAHEVHAGHARVHTCSKHQILQVHTHTHTHTIHTRHARIRRHTHISKPYHELHMIRLNL